MVHPGPELVQPQNIFLRFLVRNCCPKLYFSKLFKVLKKYFRNIISFKHFQGGPLLVSSTDPNTKTRNEKNGVSDSVEDAPAAKLVNIHRIIIKLWIRTYFRSIRVVKIYQDKFMGYGIRNYKSRMLSGRICWKKIQRMIFFHSASNIFKTSNQTCI